MSVFLQVMIASIGWCTVMTVLTVFLWRVRFTAVARAPLLDLVVSSLTWIPWVVAFCQAGWIGLAGCFVGQFIAVQVFCYGHEALSRRPGRQLCGEINRLVGAPRNHLGLWATVPALPAFILIRIAELVFYPLLIWTLKFPRYQQAEWVNVSRQKFSGLIGHDLIWCLYCDWMTGVYSLGGEMLRNVESFWCPIKFYSNKKCENCKLHFPDIEEWVDPKGNMDDVRKKFKEQYVKGKGAPRSWFGHPERKRSKR